MTALDDVKLIPRDVLFGNPEKAMARISPDGKRLAYLAPKNGVLNVWLRTIGHGDDRAITDDQERGIRIYEWAPDGRQILYLQDVGGNENWRLYAINLETGALADLTPFENVQVLVVAIEKRHADQIVIAMNRDNPQAHDAYRLNLSSGELELAARNPGNVGDWHADAELRVRAAQATRPDGGAQLLVRDDEAGDWRVIADWEPADGLLSAPYQFTADGRGLYLHDSLDSNTPRLVHIDLGSGERQVIAADPNYDVTEVIFHPDSREPQLVSFFRERRHWEVIDERLAGDMAKLREVHPGDLLFLNRDHADQTWLVAYNADDGPVAYYAYDRASQTATFLFDNQPALREYTLAPMRPIAFTARDGLIVHGYLTLPAGRVGASRPMVLDVHGGPWGRNAWGLDPEAQWLANRGYACLQVNFRGSTGYGKAFLNAGDREWGGKMHDDLIDAVNWAVEQGFADRDKIAIYGGSYGGYAALVGATFTPDVFCCAVDIVGPSSLVTLIKTIPPYWSTFVSLFHTRVGHPEDDREFLESRSPLFKAHQIKAPLLIAQGANDPRVKQAESEQIVAVLREKGIEHEYMLFPDEGHGFAKPENRIRFYAAAERFLAHHLGGRYEP
jgi:dipeptidyl aminopeptidase/acylaminoacyl peptidase